MVSWYGRQMVMPGTKQYPPPHRSFQQQHGGGRSSSTSASSKSTSTKSRSQFNGRPYSNPSSGFSTTTGGSHPPRHSAQTQHRRGGAPPPSLPTRSVHMQQASLGGGNPSGAHPGPDIIVQHTNETIEMSQLSYEESPEWGSVASSSQGSSRSAPRLGQDSVSSASGYSRIGGIAPFNQTGGHRTYTTQHQQPSRLRSIKNHDLRFNPLQKSRFAAATVTPQLTGAASTAKQPFSSHPQLQQQQQYRFLAPTQHAAYGGHGAVVQPQQQRQGGSVAPPRAPPQQFQGSGSSIGSHSHNHHASRATTTTAPSLGSYGGGGGGDGSSTHSLSQRSVHTHATAPSAVSTGSLASHRMTTTTAPTPTDARTIKALIESTLDSRLETALASKHQVKMQELDEKQRAFHQRITAAEDEHEARLGQLQKTATDGLGQIQKTIADGEEQISQKLDAMDTKAGDFDLLVEDARDLHQKTSRSMQRFTKDVEAKVSRIDLMVEAAEKSVHQVKQLTKSGLSSIAQARDDLQKTVSSVLAAIQGKKPASKARPVSTTSSGKSKKLAKSAAASKSSTKHKVSRTPLTTLKIQKSSKRSSSSSTTTTKSPYSPANTVYSCVTPSDKNIGTPPPKVTKRTNCAHANPKASRAKKRGRFGHSSSVSSSSSRFNEDFSFSFSD